MKKFTAITVTFLLVLLATTACKPKVGGVASKSQDLLTLIPQDVQGVVLVDVLDGLKVATVAEYMKKAETDGQLKEFTQKTGIDPRKDIRYLAIGLQLGADKSKQQGVGIINLKYDRDSLLANIKKEGELKQTDRNGVTIYAPPQDPSTPGTEMHGAFLDEANIVIGSPKLVEEVIDIFQGKKNSVRKNAGLNPLLKEAKSASLVWGAFLIPAEAMKQTSTQVPMLGNLDALKSVLLSIDYQNQNLLMEFKGKGTDEAKLKQMADMLTGLKAFGGMAAMEKPEIGELLNKIEITSGKDYVMISATLPEELIKKLAALAAEMKPTVPIEVPQEPQPENVPDLQ